MRIVRKKREGRRTKGRKKGNRKGKQGMGMGKIIAYVTSEKSCYPITYRAFEIPARSTTPHVELSEIFTTIMWVREQKSNGE